MGAGSVAALERDESAVASAISTPSAPARAKVAAISADTVEIGAAAAAPRGLSRSGSVGVRARFRIGKRVDRVEANPPPGAGCSQRARLGDAQRARRPRRASAASARRAASGAAVPGSGTVCVAITTGADWPVASQASSRSSPTLGEEGVASLVRLPQELHVLPARGLVEQRDLGAAARQRADRARRRRSAGTPRRFPGLEPFGRYRLAGTGSALRLSASTELHLPRRDAVVEEHDVVEREMEARRHGRPRAGRRGVGERRRDGAGRAVETRAASPARRPSTSTSRVAHAFEMPPSALQILVCAGSSSVCTVSGVLAVAVEILRDGERAVGAVLAQQRVAVRRSTSRSATCGGLRDSR